MAALMIAVLAAGCGGGGTTTTGAPETNTPAVDAETGSEGLKVVIVSSPSGVDDGSFNQDNYNGILDFIANNPDASVKTIQETDVANSVQAVSDVVADYDIIVTPGYQFAGVYDLAVNNPDKKFILVDSYPSDADGEEQSADNIYAMMFAEEESGFFAGIAAAMETESNKVAVVNGIAYPSNVNYQFGFMSGVEYANKYYGTKAEIVEFPSYAGKDVTDKDVGGNYVGDFNDPTTGKVVGEALIKEGCDIIFVAAGNSGNGVFTAAKESGGKAKVIGCDVDQYADGVSGSENIVLTSVLKNMRVNVERQLNAIADGSFKGENITLHADTDSTGYVKGEGQQLGTETLEKLEETYAKVKAGEIVPASNFNGSTPKDFKGLEEAAE
jgi:basic membrane protein A